ncbi:sterol desaturase family protein [Pseudotabrizicola formosa]|uniref:sterol desaturase family protein n=1 Tax=Pseudotabrizicola formosa TaxID=2030009 RepID=UPI00143DE422|nr:sterol desaturase family protein [Pseudotabrizicola formosa]
MDYTLIFILACIFIPLERLYPLNPDQPILRRDWKNDLFYMLFNGFVVRAGFTAVAGVAMLAYGSVAGPNPFPVLAALPLWFQVICVVIVADIGYYIAHRICHTVPFLWQFHSVHHSIEDMDWLATHRVHPVDQVFSTLVSLLPVYFLGFSAQALVIAHLLYHVHALLLHSNIKVNFGPLKWILASPEYHHWHHANEKDAYDRNFAAQLSIIDRVAGTMFLPQDRKPVAYGLETPIPRLYHQHMIHPFNVLAKRLAQRISERTPAMFARVEDNLGKLAMLLIFGYLAVEKIFAIQFIFQHSDQIPQAGLILVSQVVSALFVLLVVYFTMVRLPPKDSADGMMPRVIALLGTYIMMALVFLPPEPIGAELRIVATAIILIGTALSIACLMQLGKSFSIMASSRELRTEGAYAIVRHPLYAAELLMIVGILLSHGSVLAFGLGALWVTLQIRRAHYEEGILRATFPEYAEYARRVPMLVPGLNLRWLEAPVEQKRVSGSEPV